MKIYYKNKKEKLKTNASNYYKNNIEEGRFKRKLYARKNYNKRKDYFRKYFKDTKEKHKNYCATYYNENKKVILKKQWQYRKKRLKKDLQYYIKDRLSSRIRMAILNHQGKKNTSSIELLGADIDTVRKYIEKQFTEGMNWENHSITGWHIDHIIPCESFDLTDPEQQKKCFHYTNLQPLWWEDNLEKGATIPT